MTAQVFFFFAEYKQIEAAAAAAAFFPLFNPLQKRIATLFSKKTSPMYLFPSTDHYEILLLLLLFPPETV